MANLPATEIVYGHVCGNNETSGGCIVAKNTVTCSANRTLVASLTCAGCFYLSFHEYTHRRGPI